MSDIKVLVVEDDEITIDIVCKSIHNLGYSTITVKDGRSALYEYRKCSLIILDIGIGTPNGIIVCEEIRKVNKDIPIIFLSGHHDEDIVAKGLMVGGDDYIKKPIGVLELSARISAHLARVEQKQQSYFSDHLEVIGPGTCIKNEKGEQYKIVTQLAKGGMGVIFTGYRMSDKKYVAIKTLSSEYVSTRSDIGRFVREAQLAKKIDHPNLVSCLDFIYSDRYCCYIMEYIEGRPFKDCRLTVDESLAVISQVCEGLNHLHLNGLVHRDIKPSNLLLAKDRVVLVDMGLVKLAKGSQLTTVGVIMGTPAYLSPEQINKEEIDIRSDIYSLGITWYQLLAGELPFIEESPYQQMVARLISLPIPIEEHLPDISPAISSIIKKMLRKDPENRYQTPRQLLDDIYYAFEEFGY